jgi:hypothetical protein
VSAAHPETYLEGFHRQVRSGLARAAATRSGVERGDPFAVLSDRAMARSVDAAEGVGAPHLAALPARADHSVTDDPNRPDLPLGNLTGEANGQDADAMEHERQSRLSRWQRLPE